MVLRLSVDTTDVGAVDAAVKRVSEEFRGRVDVLVNNAAHLETYRPLADSDPDEWPTLSGPEISRRKIFLKWYLQRLNSDPNKPGYWEYLDKVA